MGFRINKCTFFNELMRRGNLVKTGGMELESREMIQEFQSQKSYKHFFKLRN